MPSWSHAPTCSAVEFFADEYAPYAPNTPPALELRGHVQVCTDRL